MNRLEWLQEESKKFGKRYTHVMERFSGIVDASESESAKVLNMMTLFARIQERDFCDVSKEVMEQLEFNDEEKKVIELLCVAHGSLRFQIRATTQNSLLNEMKRAELAGLKTMVEKFTTAQGEEAPCVKRWKPVVERMEQLFAQVEQMKK